MGIEVVVDGLTKSFGSHVVWSDVSLTLPAGEVSVMLGPSGTGKTVFLKALVGLVRPDRGRVVVDGIDTVSCSERQLYQARKLFGVMFQDGALFGSLSLFDNVAFPLREHTRLTEAEIRRVVLEKMDMVGLAGDGGKFPGEISGGMRKRAGLARALVLDPQIILCDEPDSGLDPVRTAYLSQLLIDLNAEIDATILIVTHDIQIARTVPDNIGMLFRGHLVMFGPREVLLTSENPVITQFVNGRRVGPIGMSEEKDDATLAAEQLDQAANGSGAGAAQQPALVPQLVPSPGRPERQAVQRRTSRVLSMLHTLPESAQQAIGATIPVGLAGQAAGRPARQRAGQQPGTGPGPEPAQGTETGPEPGEPGGLGEPGRTEPQSNDRESSDRESSDREGRSGWPSWLPGGGRK
jgi:phospholipid/cholesterol/gamma-HCH transport system ATP-binding protein